MDPLTASDPRSAGEFQLRARLGSGGMGRVYLGFSPAGRAVAVKVLQPGLAEDRSFLARFRQEVAAVRSVSGFYTAQVVAAGPDDRPPWLATAFVPGPALDEVVSAHGPLSEPAVWRLLAGLAEALRAVHNSGVVHRDLKPGNVLLAADGPRLIDFGISRAVEGPALTKTGEVAGTPGFMSPEQAEGTRVGPASDVFSLGCVLAYATTGTQPFGDGSAPAVIYRIVYNTPTLSGMPERVREIAAACLAKNPADRPDLPALAAASARETEGMSPSAATFWPDPLGRVVTDYQARVEAQMQAMLASPLPGGPAYQQRPAAPPVPGPVLPPRPAAPPAASPVLPPPAAPPPGYPPRPYPSPGPVPAYPPRPSPTQPVAGTPQPGAATPPRPTFPMRQAIPVPVIPARTAPTPVVRGPRPRRGVDRRRVLLIAGAMTAVGGVAGVGAWRLGSSHPSASGPLWRVTMGEASLSSLAVADGVVYAGSEDNNVYAMDAATGSRRWDYRTSDQVEAGPVVSGGVVYAGNNKGDVYALDAGSGHYLWRFATASNAVSAPVVKDGLVFVAGILETMYVLDARTGSVRKQINDDNFFNADARVAGDLILTSDATGNVTALRADDFSLAWQTPLTDADLQPMTVAGGRVYLGDDKGGLFALNAANGNKLWATRAPGFIQAAPAVGGGMVAVVCGNYLYTFRADSGKDGWKHYVGADYAMPAASGGIFYVGGFDTLYALHAGSGDVAWTYSAGLSSAPAVAGGVVYFVDVFGDMTALRKPV